MSEEVESANDGTWSGLKKTIIGTLTTVIGGGGIWLSTQLFGGHSDDEEKAKTEVAAPAAAPVVKVIVLAMIPAAPAPEARKVPTPKAALAAIAV